MPSPLSESDIERKICDYAKKHGCLVFKFVSPGHRGVPDRLFICNGVVLFLEIKRPGKRPTLLQESCIKKLRSQNIAAEWTDSFEGGVYHLKTYLLD